MPLHSLLLLAAFSPLQMAPVPAAHWTDTCRFGGRTVTLNFDSRSGDPLEDDMTVTLKRDDGAELALPLGRSLYEPRGLLLNVTNLCQRTAAVEVGEGRVLLLLSANGRPTWDVLDAALVDTASLHTLDVKENIGTIKTVDRVVVAKRVGKAALAVRLIREMLPGSGCDCESAAIEDWRLIEIVGDRIRSTWQSR